MKDYYYILGLQETANLVDIKKAYRKLSLKFHPDKNDGDKFFEDRFKEINEAFEVLSDNNKRRTYDNQRKNGKTNNNSFNNFSPVIEYFKSNKKVVDFDEVIELKWSCSNASRVELKPFGIVPPVSSKKYRIKNFDKEYLVFKLIAYNEYIKHRTSKEVVLINDTYLTLKNRIIYEYKSSQKGYNSYHNNDKKSKNIFVRQLRDRRKLEIHTFSKDSYNKGDLVFIDGVSAQDGVYQFGWFEEISVKNGRVY